MRALIAASALMSFVSASTLPYLAQAQTPAGSFKTVGDGKRAKQQKQEKKAQIQPPASAAPHLILEDRDDRKM